VAGVVGIVAAMPYRSVEVIANVTSRVRPSCVGSLAPRRRLGQGGVCARAQEGSGEAKLESEAKGSGEPELAPEAKESGETKTRARALVISGVCLIFFLQFFSLVWVSYLMVRNSSPRAFGGVKAPL